MDHGSCGVSQTTSAVIVRVPIIVLKKISTFSEICTKNLGHLGKNGDNLKN
jgi:hypothetical protein